jgi:hypothetical protein
VVVLVVVPTGVFRVHVFRIAMLGVEELRGVLLRRLSAGSKARQAGAKPGQSEWSFRNWTTRRAVAESSRDATYSHDTRVAPLPPACTRDASTADGAGVYDRESFTVARAQVRCDVVV